MPITSCRSGITSLPTPSLDRPFAGNFESQEYGADEGVMTGTCCTLPPLTQPSTLPNKPYTLTNTLFEPLTGTYTLPPTALTPTLSHTYLHRLALVFHLTPLTHTTWPMQCTLTPLPLHQPLPLPSLPQTRRAQDRKARKKASKATRHRTKRRRNPLTPTPHALLSCALPNCIFIATTMAG
jgi:hypothetical protein